MPVWKSLGISLLVPLTGCPVHTLVVVNFGIGNKSATAFAAPFDINAYCAALTRQGYIVKLKKGVVQNTEVKPDDSDKICREVWLEQLQQEQKMKETK